MKNTMIKRIAVVALIAIMVASLALGLCACNNNENKQQYSHFNETVRFDLDTTKTNVMDMEIGPLLIPMLLNGVFDREQTYMEFRPDGKMHFQLQTKAGLLGDIDGLLGLLSRFNINIDIEEMLSSIELAGMLNDYVEPMFPGFTAKVKNGDLEGALNLISRSLGLNIVGLDYSNENVKAVIKEIGESETMSLPADLLERLPSDTVLTLTWDDNYYLWDVTGHDGKTYTAIAISDVGKTSYTQPWCVFDLSTNEDGLDTLFFRAEFMMSQLAFTKHVEQAQA